MIQKNNQDSELNPNLVILKDNKAKWYLPETRRDGYRNLHKINRYGVLLRSDLVLKLRNNHQKNSAEQEKVNAARANMSLMEKMALESQGQTMDQVIRNRMKYHGRVD